MSIAGTTTFTTPFNNNTMTLKEYLTGQAIFSTAIGYLVCKIPLLQSMAIGLAAEGCRYATDKAISYLSDQIPFINSNKTVAKTALVAGSFFVAHTVINTVLPGSSCLFRASFLFATTYLFAEPIVQHFKTAYSSNLGICTTFHNIKASIFDNYKDNDICKKITDLWNREETV